MKAPVKLLKEAHEKILSKGDFGAVSVDSFKLLSVRVLAALVGFLIHIPLARTLGVSEYGFYALIMSIVMIATPLTRMGTDFLFIKYVPLYLKNNQWPQIQGLILFSAATCFFMCFAVTSIIGLAIQYDLYDSRRFGAYYPYLTGILFLTTAVFVLGGLLRGYKRIISSEIFDRILRPLFLIGFFFLIVWIANYSVLDAALLATVLAGALCLLFMLMVALKAVSIPGEYKKRFAFRQKEWMLFSFPMVLVTSTEIIQSHTDIIMLGTMRSAAEAGVYSIATKISALAAFGLAAINAVLAPYLSSHFADQNKEKLQILLKQIAWLCAGLTLPITLFIAVISPFLLPAFGEGFQSAYLPLLIILIAQIINTLCGSVGFLLYLGNQQRKATLIMLMALAINIAGNYLLIPAYGTVGAAIASLISMTFWNLTMLYVVMKKLGLNPTIFGKSKTIPTAS